MDGGWRARGEPPILLAKPAPPAARRGRVLLKEVLPLQTLTTRVSLAFTLVALVGGWAAACSSSNETNASSGGTLPDAGATPDSSDDAAPDADSPEVDASTPPDAGAPDADTPDADTSACQSPFTVASDPAAEAKAKTALQALSPAATLTWAPARGTLASIDSIVLPLPGCTGTKDVYDQLFDILDKSPDLFQIDRTEWHTSGAVQCSDVLSSGFHTLVLHRAKYGPYALDNDVFSVVADVKNGSVILRNFSGVYIPRPTPALVATLQACVDKSDADLEAPLRAQAFDYEKFAPPPAPPCTLAGKGSYTATASDTLTFDPAVTLRWEETDVVKIHRERAATLVVAPVNYTPALQNSDANCTGDTGQPNIGWIRTFDAITGAVLYDKHNPDPYCNVC